MEHFLTWFWLNLKSAERGIKQKIISPNEYRHVGQDEFASH